MIFLIHYDTTQGRLLSLEAFTEEDMASARAARLRLELELGDEQSSHEVVLLDAPNEEQIRHTHSRYFRSEAAST